MAQIVYPFSRGGQQRALLSERVLAALYSAVIDLDEQRAEPVAIRLYGRVLYDRAALERVRAACRADLLADPWRMPAGLKAAARRELPP
jgi:hypothetical protein